MKIKLDQQIRVTQFMTLYKNLIEQNLRWVTLRASERMIIQYEDNERIFVDNWGLANNMLNETLITNPFFTSMDENSGHSHCCRRP